MFERDKFWRDARDRAAYMYITGQFPSHLRTAFTRLLRHSSRCVLFPVSMDGRRNGVKLHEFAVRDMELSSHPMVKMARKKIGEGYRIQPSRGIGTRRNYWKIFLYRLNPDGLVYGKITVKGDGAIKMGW